MIKSRSLSNAARTLSASKHLFYTICTVHLPLEHHRKATITKLRSTWLPTLAFAQNGVL